MLKILVIRNDKIGDFMLAWPSFALLKSQYPNAEISALVPEYTAPLAKECEWIDKILIDDKKSSFIPDVLNLSKKIKQQNFDLSISLFSETRTSLALWLSGIKLRIGPATKIAQIFLSHTLRQKRSQSLKPEYKYNLDLVEYYIHLNSDIPVSTPLPPYLRFNINEIKQLQNTIKNTHNIPDNQKVVIIHPCTGGSAINLSINQYAELAKQLSTHANVFFIITAGPGELSQATELSKKLQESNHVLHESKRGIVNFCKYINVADIFISGSTGPLHIAGALNINTVAFYPAKKSASPTRWQTINSENNRLFFSPGSSKKNTGMNEINTSYCAHKIANHFLI